MLQDCGQFPGLPTRPLVIPPLRSHSGHWNSPSLLQGMNTLQPSALGACPPFSDFPRPLLVTACWPYLCLGFCEVDVGGQPDVRASSLGLWCSLMW